MVFKVPRWEQRSTKRLKIFIPSWKASARQRRTCSSFFYLISQTLTFFFFFYCFLLYWEVSTICWLLKVDCCVRAVVQGCESSLFFWVLSLQCFQIFFAVLWSQVMAYFTHRPFISNPFSVFPQLFSAFSVVLNPSLIVHKTVKKCKKRLLEKKQSEDCFLFLF